MRFPLKSLFGAITVGCVGLALWAHVREAERQFNAARQLLEARGFAIDSARGEDGTVMVFGDDLVWDATTAHSISMLGRVQRLSLFDVRLSDEQAEALFAIPGLRELYIGGGEASGAVVEQLVTSAQSLESLELDNVRLLYTDIGRLADIATLRRLVIKVPTMANTECPSAESRWLDVPSMHAIETIDIEVPGPVRVHAMPQVRAMRLVSGSHIHDVKGYVVLGTCPQLKSLYIDTWTMGDDEYALLSAVDMQPVLDELTIVAGRIARTDMQFLAQLPVLRVLSLDSTWIAGDAVALFGHLQAIEVLTLRYVNVEPSSQTDVLSGSDESAHDRGTKMRLAPDQTGVSVPALQECSELRQLSIKYGTPSPVNVGSLSMLTQLRKLDLSGFVEIQGVTRRLCLSDLAPLDELRFLDELVVDVVDLPEVRIREALPNTRVIQGL